MALFLCKSKSSANMFFHFADVIHLKVISSYIFIVTRTVANSRRGYVYSRGKYCSPPPTHTHTTPTLGIRSFLQKRNHCRFPGTCRPKSFSYPHGAPAAELDRSSVFCWEMAQRWASVEERKELCIPSFPGGLGPNGGQRPQGCLQNCAKPWWPRFHKRKVQGASNLGRSQLPLSKVEAGSHRMTFLLLPQYD